MFGRRVVRAAHRLEAGTGTCHHDVAAGGLVAHVVHREGYGVDYGAQVDFEGEEGWLEQVSCFVERFCEVVGAACDAGVGEDVVD